MEITKERVCVYVCIYLLAQCLHKQRKDTRGTKAGYL